MVKAEITIEGIAIWYDHDDGKFRVLLPFDDVCHRAVLTGLNLTGVELAKPGQKVTIRIDSPPGIPVQDLSPLMDITDHPHSHNNITVIDDGNVSWSDNAVLLIIDKGRFSSAEDTYCRWGLTDTAGTVTMCPRIIAYSGKLELEGERIWIECDPPIEGIGEVPDKTVIKINNSCSPEDQDENADFKMIYKVIKDLDIPGKEFVIKRHPDDEPNLFAFIIELIKSILKGGSSGGVKPSITSWILGILNNNPLRFAKGLPCNNVRASKPINLPTGIASPAP